MQWEALFHKIRAVVQEDSRYAVVTGQFWEGGVRERHTVYAPGPVHPPDSGNSFGEDLHAADLGRDAELGSLFFDADDGRLAADPALFARGEFGRQN